MLPAPSDGEGGTFSNYATTSSGSRCTALTAGFFHSPIHRLKSDAAHPSPHRTIMSLSKARSWSQGMKVIPRGVNLASTQWLLVFFCTPHVQVNNEVAAISCLLSLRLVACFYRTLCATLCIYACGVPVPPKLRKAHIYQWPNFDIRLAGIPKVEKLFTFESESRGGPGKVLACDAIPIFYQIPRRTAPWD